jgi:hypothetical protein
MSAYVVDDSTINKIVSFLNAKAMGYDGRHRYKIEGYDLSKEDDCERLANDMFALNVAGVNARYGEGEAAKFRPLNFIYRFQIPQPVIPTLVALECFLYQCAEGDIVNHPLYLALRRLESAMCQAIVHALPEYSRASWG